MISTLRRSADHHGNGEGSQPVEKLAKFDQLLEMLRSSGARELAVMLEAHGEALIGNCERKTYCWVMSARVGDVTYQFRKACCQDTVFTHVRRDVIRKEIHGLALAYVDALRSIRQLERELGVTTWHLCDERGMISRKKRSLLNEYVGTCMHMLQTPVVRAA